MRLTVESRRLREGIEPIPSFPPSTLDPPPSTLNLFHNVIRSISRTQ